MQISKQSNAIFNTQGDKNIMQILKTIFGIILLGYALLAMFGWLSIPARVVF